MLPVRFGPHDDRNAADRCNVYGAKDKSTAQNTAGTDGLLYYGARYYDAYLDRWAQADTTIPQPGNPQSFNRYTYAYNNPIRFTDPSGRDPVDSLRDFFNGVLLHWSYNNVMTPQAREALTVHMANAQDPVAVTIGRHGGNLISIWQAIVEADAAAAIITGGGVGGAATCLETIGGGCVAGAAVATHGAAVGLIAAGEEGNLLRDAFKNVSQAKGQPSGQPSTEPGRGGWKRVDDKWLERQGIDAHAFKRSMWDRKT